MTPRQQLEVLAQGWEEDEISYGQKGASWRDQDALTLAEWYEGRASGYRQCAAALREVLALIDSDEVKP